MKPQEMIDVIQAYIDGKSVETNDGGPDWWPVLSPQFNFSRFTYRIKPSAPAMWQYFWSVGKCTANDPNDDDCQCWFDEGTGPLPDVKRDFTNLNWRPANLPAPALRPHWPAILHDTQLDLQLVENVLFATIEEAKEFYPDRLRVIRLATEYPPVMLP